MRFSSHWQPLLAAPTITYKFLSLVSLYFIHILLLLLSSFCCRVSCAIYFFHFCWPIFFFFTWFSWEKRLLPGRSCLVVQKHDDDDEEDGTDEGETSVNNSWQSEFLEIKTPDADRHKRCHINAHNKCFARTRNGAQIGIWNWMCCVCGDVNGWINNVPAAARPLNLQIVKPMVRACDGNAVAKQASNCHSTHSVKCTLASNDYYYYSFRLHLYY